MGSWWSRCKVWLAAGRCCCCLPGRVDGWLFRLPERPSVRPLVSCLTLGHEAASSVLAEKQAMRMCQDSCGAGAELYIQWDGKCAAGRWRGSMLPPSHAKGTSGRPHSKAARAPCRRAAGRQGNDKATEASYRKYISFAGGSEKREQAGGTCSGPLLLLNSEMSDRLAPCHVVQQARPVCMYVDGC